MAQNLKINILAHDKTKQAFNGIKGRLSGLKNAVLSVKGALVGIGAGLVVKQFVDVGRTVEDLQVRLKQLFGSTQEGAKAFQVMTDFASKVPFSLEQIQQASGNLAVVAGDSERLAKILEITGNVAAVTGLDFATTAEQIQRSFSAGIASADIFRERGVRDMLGFSAGATVSAEETIKAFEKVFGSRGKFGTATDELANTFTGTLSMLSDSVFKFQKRVADEEFFNTLKGEFKALDTFIKENEATFNDIADAIGTTLSGAVKILSGTIKGIATAVDFVTEAYETLLETLNKLPFVDIEFKTKEQRQLEREMLEIARKRDLQMQHQLITIDSTNKSLATTTKELKKQKNEVKNIFDAHIKYKKNVEAENSLRIELLDKVKKQNEEFSLSKNIFDGINRGVGAFSRGLAEAVVLGKSLNKGFREFAQAILVEVIAKTIERITLLGVEKILSETIFKNEKRKTDEIDRQNRKLKQQMAFRGATSLFGGIGGIIGGFLGFDKGGAVSKGKPIMVGERGPELFVPNQTGQITQSARGTDSGATTVNFNINTVDASGFEELLVRSRGTITQLINSAVNERGREALI
jgi:hypothetical protein